MNLQTIITTGLAVSALLNLFSIGLRANLEDVIYLFRRPGDLFRAILAMNVLMPVLMVALILLFDFNPAVKIALVALSLSPIPPPVPAKMVKQGGTQSYALGLHVALGTLAIIFVPLALELIGMVRGLDLHIAVTPVAKVVFISVLIPIALGILVHKLAPSFAERIANPIKSITGIGLLVCIVAVWIGAAPTMWSLIGNGTVIALVVFVVLGLVIGHLLGGPEPEKRTSLAISTSSRHPGVALAIASATFPDEKLVVAAVLLYLLVNTIFGIPYLIWTKRQEPVVDNPVIKNQVQDVAQ